MERSFVNALAPESPKARHPVAVWDSPASAHSILDFLLGVEDGPRLSGRTIRILDALLEAMIADWNVWHVLGAVESAILRGRPVVEREGWSQSKTRLYLAANGWKSESDIYDAIGIPEDRRVVVDLDTKGWTEPEIASHVGVSLRTVQLWLHDAREAMRGFAKLHPLEIPSPVAGFSLDSEGIVATRSNIQDAP